MDNPFLLVMAFTLAGSVLSVAAAAVYLLLPAPVRERSLDYLLGFAIGMLLGAGFLHLLPEALEQARDSTQGLMGTALFAILVFFILEKGLIWRHHHHHHGAAGEHDHDEDSHGSAAMASGDDSRPVAALILIGDSVHNFLDGILIAAAFLADPALGIVTALAVIAHEIPQELSDFAILLHSGYSRTKALAYNMLSSLAMIVGAVVAWFALGRITVLVPYLLTFTAASFIYIAVSDLMPALNRKVGLRETVVQVVLIGCGLGLNILLNAGH